MNQALLINKKNIRLTCIIMLAMIAPSVFADIEQELLIKKNQSRQNAPQLECSATNQPTVRKDKVLIKAKYSAELKNKTDWFLIGDKKKYNACYISANKALQLLDKEGAIFTDIRPSKYFVDLNITGSINVPARLVKTKSFLKSKPVILINKGIRHSDLEKLCLKLRGLGFKSVHILKGGLMGWNSKQKPIKGSSQAMSELNVIKPEDFYSEKGYGHWQVINIEETKKNQNSVISMPIPPTFFNNQIVQMKWMTKLQKIITKKKRAIDEHSIVLFIDNNGRQTERLLSIFRKTDFARKINQGTSLSFLVRMQGGIEAYQQFLRNRLAISSYEPVLNKNRGCGG